MNVHFLFDVFQFLVVFILVVGCTVYCLLTLAPNVIKQPLKLALLRCPLPAFASAKLRQTTATGACGSGCCACSASPSAPKTMKWHPRKR